MRALSGIQATGDITLGNYLGALRRWAAMQDRYDENFFFIPDLHTLTVRVEPKQLHEAVYSTTAWLLAAGIDPKRSTIYLQSDIPAHAELCWILNNHVTMGELNRMTQYKDKSAKHGQLVGLFTYPVLQAADILLYSADVVPVGEDQVQHIELARDIASRFNNLYGETFTLPKADLDKDVAKVMDLQDPTKKMSKSEAAQSLGVLRMLDSEEKIRQKILKATTDSGQDIKRSAGKPGITNLIAIYSVLSNQNAKSVEDSFVGKNYGEFKKELGEIVVQAIKPLQKRYSELIKDKKQIEKVLQMGKVKAEPIATKKLAQVKEKIGLLQI